ncbi:1-acyl-sn-glycerol-3-phosphate acyltransferase [Leisingera sp. ANG-M7]|uniref:1-acyl-sn-glycerol-3-phosphate acyltransferase n=1 Tax=Leisingera sp. ANG-M7 TaxID=1577902 RepID=UPI00057F4396|nr:1-acyl-sn-glycerol-3-phosphate acyltransferase [Leisingera sp. ANG-M7]KIC38111.1 glycerol-3-phosphate acyltransferase [Leisingera sp. ANG-M7]
MTQTVELPLWLFVLIVGFATVTFASHFLFPSVRWFFRRRLERAVARLNKRLERPIEPFKLARRHDMIQRLIHDPQVAQAAADHAEAEGIPENVAFEQVRRYAREIVPGFSAFAYFSLAIRAARFLSNAVYRVRLGHQDEEALRAIDPNATVVFVMNHRSNMDYVLVTYLAAERSALSYAVGEWARVWPLSRLIRAMGAYFIRRRSRNGLYRKVLAAYVRLATRGGSTQAMFPEGGLSLDGALVQPRLGLLKYIVEGYDPDRRDVVFVPVALNYDRVLEDKILTSAAKAGDRRFKARIGLVALRLLRQLWLWMTGRYRRAGYAAVNFGRPLSLAGFGAGREGDITKPLARELMQRISGIVPVLPVPLISAILLRQGPLSRAAIEHRLEDLVAAMPLAHVHIPRDDLSYAAEAGLSQLLRRGLVMEAEGRITPMADRQDLLEFYANSIHHLLPEDSGLPGGYTDFSAPAKNDAAFAGS